MLVCNTTLSYLPDGIWKPTFGILCVLVSLLATCENAVVIIIIYKNKILQTPSNKILLSLAVSNFLTGTILAPLYVVQLLDEQIIRLCMVDLVRRYLSAVLLGSALFTVGFISYDRCLHLLYLKSYKMSKRKMMSILLLCWFIPILVPLLRYIGENESIYAIIVIILGSVMLTVVVISYIALLVALHNHTKHTDNKMFRTHMSNERRTGRTVIIIVSISFFVGVPLLIYFGMLLGGERDVVVLSKTYVIVMILSMLNAVLKPLVYCYRTPLLRKYSKKLFGINQRNGAGSARYVSNNAVSLDTVRTFSSVSSAID